MLNGSIRFMRARSACMVRWLAAVLLCCGVAGALAQPLPPELQQAWRATGLPQSALGLQVQAVGGAPLMAVNPAEPRNPASVMKVVTTWAALLGLGPEYRWRTSMLADQGGRIDAQGSLSGPLYIRAAGDPLFSVANLWSMLSELRMRGVKNLSEVIVDRSVFGAVAIDPGRFDGAGDRPYNASPDAMMVGLGAMRLLFHPDQQGQKWVPVIDPPVQGVRIVGDVAWRSGVCPGAPAVATQVLRPSATDIQVQVSGEAVASCGPFSVWRLVLSQEQYFDRVFRMLWRQLGGTLARDVRAGNIPAGAQPMVWHDSGRLSDLIRDINKQSNNVMARTLLLGLGAHIDGSGATTATAARTALDILRQNGVNTQSWVIENGAGLSRIERLTAGGLAGMLDQAWSSPLMPEFISSMAISGVDGTMRRRLRNSDARGMAHLKTGTLRDARALAGYVLGASGTRYILVSMVNHEKAIAARSFEDALVDWLSAR